MRWRTMFTFVTDLENPVKHTCIIQAGNVKLINFVSVTTFKPHFMYGKCSNCGYDPDHDTDDTHVKISSG